MNQVGKTAVKKRTEANQFLTIASLHYKLTLSKAKEQVTNIAW